MNTKDLIRLGVPPGAPLKAGMEFVANFIGRFDPRLVKMCPSGERPED